MSEPSVRDRFSRRYTSAVLLGVETGGWSSIVGLKRPRRGVGESVRNAACRAD